MASVSRSTLQHRVWRWHFFAGLMVVPFVLILSVTGAIYLFKPQYDASVERQINAQADPESLNTRQINAEAGLKSALEAYPGSRLVRLVLPVSEEDRTLEAETVAGDGVAYTLWLDKVTGRIIHQAKTDHRLMNFVKRIHGTLLGGDLASLLVETVACWAIILIITGLFLFWPRSGPWWRAFIPDFSSAKRPRQVLLKLHGSVGFWVSGLALIMLLSGLPWTQVWGDGFTRAKALAGLKSPGQEWFVTLQSSDPHALHDMGGSLWETETVSAGDERSTTEQMIHSAPLTLDAIISKAADEGLAPPVWVQPPRGENGVWTVRGMNANRMRQETIHYDRWSGEEVMRIRFADHNVVDRTMALGVSFHEGALFGWPNQITGLLAAISVAGLSVTGALMWWMRRPKDRIGIPPMPGDRRIATGVFVMILVLGVFLPMAGLTLMICLIADMIWGCLMRLRKG